MAIRSDRIYILGFQRLQTLSPVATYSNKKVVWIDLFFFLRFEINLMYFLIYLTQWGVTFALDSFVIFQAEMTTVKQLFLDLSYR